MASQRISVRLDVATREKLKQEVNATGKTESELVRDALTMYFGNKAVSETCLDLARRKKLIGRGKGMPRDLSTNPKHFEGFGK